MAKIVFTMWPALGHLIPTLKLARRLRSLGHSVCYIGLSEFEPYITSQGFEFLTVLNEVDNLGQLSKVSPSEISAQIIQAFDRTKPDLLILDELLRNFAATARKIGIPSLLISITLEERHLRLGNVQEEDSASDVPGIALCPAEFDFPDAVRSKNSHYVEASIDLERTELRPFYWDKIDESKPLIYCSLGSHSDVYEQSQKLILAVLEAIESRPEWQLVLATGSGFTAPIGWNIPENALVVEWAPQLEILKKSSIMLTHGGLGAIKECIFFGVPMIVFPMKWDQLNNAKRVVYHGLGVSGNSDEVTSRQLGSFIDLLNNDGSFKSKIASMSKIFREAEELARGAKIIEEVLNDSLKYDAAHTF
jgi:UDP:flavonoid glycosyltransferase YjiC (YdhE family)